MYPAMTVPVTRAGVPGVVATFSPAHSPTHVIQSVAGIKKAEISGQPELLTLVSREFEHQPEFLSSDRQHTHEFVSSYTCG